MASSKSFFDFRICSVVGPKMSDLDLSLEASYHTQTLLMSHSWRFNDVTVALRRFFDVALKRREFVVAASWAGWRRVALGSTSYVRQHASATGPCSLSQPWTGQVIGRG